MPIKPDKGSKGLENSIIRKAIPYGHHVFKYHKNILVLINSNRCYVTINDLETCTSSVHRLSLSFFSV